MKDPFGHQKEERFDGEPMWAEDTGEAQHEQPEAPAPEPEVEPEPAPLGYIECRIEQWSTFDGFNISERPKIELRPRRPEDGDAEFRIITTPPPIPIQTPKTGPKQGLERDSDWRPGVDPQLLRRFIASQNDDTPQRPDSTAALRWIGGGFAR